MQEPSNVAGVRRSGVGVDSGSGGGGKAEWLRD